MNFGSWAFGAREIQQGAMLLPGIRLVEGGTIREDVWRMIMGMTRLPHILGLDLKAMIAANGIAARRLGDLMARYGADRSTRSCGRRSTPPSGSCARRSPSCRTASSGRATISSMTGTPTRSTRSRSRSRNAATASSSTWKAPRRRRRASSTARRRACAAAIWTRDIRQALTMARRVQAGHLWINGFSAHYLGVPFGGMKNSGVGREEGIEEMFSYTESKTINVVF